MNFIHQANQIGYYNDQNQMLAEITFPAVDASTVNINHTFVDGSLRGQGIAGKLMEAAIKQIEGENKTIIPSCSYAVKWFTDHPQYNFLLHDNQ